MSQSSIEKLREDSSSFELDEDSGHDSVDDFSTPADERERIASLETAVAWIREEVSQLKNYDKDILQELWRIRNTVQTLREAEKKSNKEERKYLDESIDDRSPTPESHPMKIEESPTPPSTMKTGNREEPKDLTPRSSDDVVLEEFFGTEQLTKLDMFKKQLSTDNLSEDKEKQGGGEGLPQIAEMEGEEPAKAWSPTPLPLSMAPDQIKMRLSAKRLSSDANRMSYDVCSEMEKLRVRLQETAMQELAEFDRKFSPKLHHHTGGALGMVAGSNNHSRQGSLDSSIPSQEVSTPAHKLPFGGHGHMRQHSLPIDPKYLKQLQTQSNESGLTQQQQRASGSTNHMDTNRSPSPPLLYGHIRQVSGGSMSSEGSAFSPPPTPVLQLATGSSSSQDSHTQMFHHSSSHSSTSSGKVAAYPMTTASGGMPGQHFTKQGKPPGLTRIGSDSSFNNYPYNRHLSNSVNSLTRTSPEGGEGQGSSNRSSRASSNASSQPHYSTAVIKRGNGSSKRSSLEITMPPQVGEQYGGHKMPNGRPNAYEQPTTTRRSYGEDMEGLPLSRGGSNVSVGSRYTQFSPPRMEGNLPASPRLSRLPDRRTTVSQTAGKGPLHTRASEPANMTARNHREEIEPYMTSAQIKSQMGFSYTPFSHQRDQRSYTVAAADAPKLAKQSGKNTWI